MSIPHQPSLHLKLVNPIVTRLSGLIALGIITLLMLLLPRIAEREITIVAMDQVTIEQFDIPETQQLELPPPPARPSVPIESESEDIAEDLTIEETTFEHFNILEGAPPPPESGPSVRFIPYDEPPIPIGGYSAIQANIVYPEIAREAGIEGTVIVKAFIDRRGRVLNTIVLAGVPNTGLDEAAAEAIRKTRFKPAKQRDRPVGVWISIPVHFRLKGP
jgi:protein TonB